MSGFTEIVKADYLRIQPGRRFSILRVGDALLTNPGMLAVVIYRIQAVLSLRGHRRLAAFIRVANNALTGADILPGSTIGAGLLLPHPTGVVIGHGVTMGSNCTVLQGVTVGEKFADGTPPHLYPKIGDRVVIGAGAIILGDILIGDDVSIAANSVVLNDVPPRCVVAGSPAKIIRSDDSLEKPQR